MASDSEQSIPQMRALAIAPKVFASMSATATTVVILMIGLTPEKRGSMFHRLFAAICISDLMRSLSFVIGTRAMPQDEPNTLYAVGNPGSCKTQAFFIQTGITVPIYTCVFFSYIALSIKNNFKNNIQHVEKLLHCIVVTFAISTSLIIHFIETPKSLGSWCGYPPSDKSVNLKGLYFWITVLCGLHCFMALAYMSVTERQKRITRSSWSGKKRFMEVARARKAWYAVKQTALYLFVLLLSNICFIIADYPSLTTSDQSQSISSSSYALILIGNILISLSGFFNAIIYSQIFNKPQPEIDCSASIRLRDTNNANLSIVSHGFNPSLTRIGSTFGYVFDIDQHAGANSADFEIFTGHDDVSSTGQPTTIGGTLPVSENDRNTLSGFSDIVAKDDNLKVDEKIPAWCE